MKELLISDWNGVDPTAFYTNQLKEYPLSFSAAHNLWVANSYDCCKHLLLNQNTRIPDPSWPEGSQPDPLLLLLTGKLARLNNGENHAQARLSAQLLFEKIRSVDIVEILKGLIGAAGKNSIDWVPTVAKKLPAMLIANVLGFDEADTAWTVDHLGKLVKIMSPQKSLADVAELNDFVSKFWGISAKQTKLGELGHHLAEAIPGLSLTSAIELLCCNLLGLLIQSYDAGRGLLSNCLLQIACPEQEAWELQTDGHLKNIVTEVLRLNPPVHNTRRQAVADLQIGRQVIKEGQQVLIVMAAANLDKQIFQNPSRFDPDRSNNDTHLTFGIGGHACLAKYLMIDMAAETCRYLLLNYKLVIPAQVMEYEPQKNVRLLKRLLITLNA